MTQPMDESNLRGQVSAWLNSGLAVPEVERRLREGGAAPEYASSIVNAVLAKQVSDSMAQERRQARAPLLGGVALCVLGVLTMIEAVLAYVRPDLGLPASVATFGVGVVVLGAGVTLLIRVVL